MRTLEYLPIRLARLGTYSATSGGDVTLIGEYSTSLARFNANIWLSVYIALGSSVLALVLSVLASWRSWKRARGAIVLS